MGSTMRARPVPGAIGLTARMLPVFRIAPVVLTAVACAPAARKLPVVLIPPVVRAGSAGRPAPGGGVSQGGSCSVAGWAPVLRAQAPVSRRGIAPVSRRGIAPVWRPAGGADGGAAGRSAGSTGCAAVARTRQDVVQRWFIGESAHSGGGSWPVGAGA
jgi:hypothetical protein